MEYEKIPEGSKVIIWYGSFVDKKPMPISFGLFILRKGEAFSGRRK